MWTIILNLLGKYWKSIALVLVIGAAFGYVKYLQHEIKSDVRTIGDQKKMVQALQLANGQLYNAVQLQNDALTTANKNLLEQQAAMNGLSPEIKQEHQKVQTQINAIEAQPEPDTCEAAIKYLLDNRPKFQ